MKRIGKGLFKVISICVSACLFVHTIAYAAPTLRVNSIFDSINEGKDKKHVEDVLSTVAAKVASNNDIEKRIKAIFKELRPDFKGEEELTVYEFEDHIRLKAKELGVKYKHVKINAWNTIIINLREAISDAIGYIFRGEKSPIAGPLGLIVFTVVPFANASFKGKYNSLKKIKIVTPGFFSFVTPLVVVISAVILEIFGVNVLPISSDLPLYHLILTFVLSFPGAGIMLNLDFYRQREEIFLHELEHVYLELFEYRLIKEGIIKEPIELEGPDKEGMRKMLFKKTINRADSMILEENALIDTLAELKDEVKQTTLASIEDVVVEVDGRDEAEDIHRLIAEIEVKTEEELLAFFFEGTPMAFEKIFRLSTEPSVEFLHKLSALPFFEAGVLRLGEYWLVAYLPLEEEVEGTLSLSQEQLLALVSRIYYEDTFAFSYHNHYENYSDAVYSISTDLSLPSHFDLNTTIVSGATQALGTPDMFVTYTAPRIDPSTGRKLKGLAASTAILQVFTKWWEERVPPEERPFDLIDVFWLSKDKITLEMREYYTRMWREFLPESGVRIEHISWNERERIADIIAQAKPHPLNELVMSYDPFDRMAAVRAAHVNRQIKSDKEPLESRKDNYQQLLGPLSVLKDDEDLEVRAFWLEVVLYAIKNDFEEYKVDDSTKEAVRLIREILLNQDDEVWQSGLIYGVSRENIIDLITPRFGDNLDQTLASNDQLESEIKKRLIHTYSEISNTIKFDTENGDYLDFHKKGSDIDDEMALAEILFLRGVYSFLNNEIDPWKREIFLDVEINEQGLVYLREERMKKDSTLSYRFEALLKEAEGIGLDWNKRLNIPKDLLKSRSAWELLINSFSITADNLPSNLPALKTNRKEVNSSL